MAKLLSKEPEAITAVETPLAKNELELMNAFWRACNYLSVGMIYLKDNPLLKEPLKTEHVKHRLLGHWGASPALSFVWVHLNRMIVKHDLDVIFVAGPGHGAPGVLGPAYLEGTYSEIYPDKSQDAEGMQKFFKQFSFPGHIGSHVTPETPGSIHEGGELGYSLSHAYGMALDNPDLIVACVVGDGEAETGPLATAWHSNKFLNPARDGAVLPILNLNGYKIANPTVLSRISHEELEALFIGYGYTPYFVEGSDPAVMHQKMADTLERAIGEIRAQQKAARASNTPVRPRWPMIVLRSPKGWTGPKEIKGHKVEGSWRSHQVPFSDVRDNPANLKLLEDWMRSYKPEELFDAGGRLVPELRALAPAGNRRMSANPHANGGLLRKPLKLPDFRAYAVEVSSRGTAMYENTKPLGEYLRDVMKNNPTSFRVFGPDETASNRLQAVYEASKKTWMADMLPEDADGGELVARWARHGNALGAHAGRLAGGLPAHGASRVLPHLRGVRARHRFHVQPARQVARHQQEPRAVARLGRVREHPVVVHGLAPGPQRVLSSGSGVHRSGDQQGAVGHARLPAARRQHAAIGRRPLPSQHRLHQCHRCRQTKTPAVHDDARGDRALHAKVLASGRGRAPMRARNRMSCWHPAATWPPWRRWRQPPSCASGRRI